MPSYIGEVTDYRNLFLDQPATRTFVLTSIIRVDDFLLCCCKDFSDSILTQTWQLSPFLFRNFNPYQLIAKDELDIKTSRFSYDWALKHIYSSAICYSLLYLSLILNQAHPTVQKLWNFNF